MSDYAVPDWYAVDQNVFDEAEPDFFVGRKDTMDSYWKNLFTRRVFLHNMALISQRKMGKTALLKRFCNVLYSEQREVVPLFYTFSQEETRQKLLIDKVADDMLLTFVKQFAAFFFQKPEFFTVVDRAYLLEEILAIDNPISKFIEKQFEYYDKDIIKEIGQYKIQRAFDMVLAVVQTAGLRCAMVIDEVQEMDLSIYDENDKLIHGSSALTRIYQKTNIIWLVVTGSKVSCIANQVIVDAMRNRISLMSFYPLRDNETEFYVQKLLTALEEKGYDGIAEDIFRLTGGNPYYIQQIFYPSNWYTEIKRKQKKFDCLESVMEVFNFEVRNNKGTLYDYWSTHFERNTDNLNCDGNKPGITAKILHYVAIRSMELEKKEMKSVAQGNTSNLHHEQRILFSEIAKKLRIDIDLVKAKAKQLVDADFIEASVPGSWVIRITDRILPIYLVEHYYEKIFDKFSKENINKEIDNIIEGFCSIQKEQQKVKKRLAKVEIDQKKTEKKVKSNSARMSNIKGIHGEEFVKQAIKDGLGIFKRYKNQIAAKTFVPNGNGKMYDIDLFLNGETKKRILPLAIEVKNRESKVTINDAKHFVQVIDATKKEYKITKINAYFVSKKGISKSAQKLFDKNNIKLIPFSEIC